MTTTEKIRELAQQQTGYVQEQRRRIHANPELSYEEKETAALVAAELKALGLEVVENVGGRHGNGTALCLPVPRQDARLRP